ncbi:MAG: dTMP kinase [Actinomycetota bacterium]
MPTTVEEIAVLRGTRPATFKELLRNRGFARLFINQLVGSLGNWIGFAAISVLAIRLGGASGAYALAAVMGIRLLPGILFGAVAGALVDRFDRRRLMMTSDAINGVIYALVPFVPNLWSLYALTFLIECVQLVWAPARDASMPNLVPERQLGNANSLSLISAYGPLPIAGAIFAILAGISTGLESTVPLLDRYPEMLAFWLDALTFGFSVLMLSRMDIPSPPATREKVRLGIANVVDDIREGVRFLRESSLASAMTTGIVIAFSAVGAVLAVGPIFVRDTLGAGAAGWGLVQTTVGLGLAVGMIGGARGRPSDRDRVFVIALGASAATLFVLASLSSLGAASVISVALGLLCGASWVNGYVVLQEHVEDEYRGRTFAALTVLSRLGLFLSLTLFPILAGIVGPDHGIDLLGWRVDLSGNRVALWLAGAMVLGASTITWRGLLRHRVSRPIPLRLVPRMKRPRGDGLFIAFEGVEGAGKGTQIERAASALRARGHDVLTVREPGGTPLGERIRSILLDRETGAMQARAEAMLFAAARAQLVAQVIRPAIAAGKVVLCDRYIDSSVAYQGMARGLGEEDVLTLNAWGTQGLFPDLVLLLHLDPAAGLERARADGADRIEKEDLAFHAKVADAYAKIAVDHPERLTMVDTTGLDEDAVAARVLEAIERSLRDRSDDDGA